MRSVEVMGGRDRGISAKLFCKHSQLTFIPYEVVLKDERPTSNKKQTSNTEHSTTISFHPF